jgi:signal transduction histidine kinase
LQKKYQKLKSLEDREEEFVSSKANQITEPIQDILEYAKLAKSGQMVPNEALDGVLRVAKKLQNVTTVVLDTNRVTNDSLTVSKKNLNINEIISDVIDSVKSTEVNVPIRVGLDHGIEIPVDRVRLSQVIQTILNNAIKYTKTGHIKVESFVAHQQNLFIIRINDTGKGIPKEILPKLFDKEIRENRKDGNDAKLSLYLCQGIIEAHGGKITAKNNEGGGCTFTITLPIKKST